MSALLALAVGHADGRLQRGSIHKHWVQPRFSLLSWSVISLPTFLIGILLILIFSVQLGWLPSFGRGQVTDLGGWSTGLLTASGWKSIVLPAITLGLFQLTLTMRLVRSEMLEVLRTDYIKFARARGLSNRAINFGHALKNTLIPVITITGLQLGSIIAFAIITETVFQWPGMGLLFLQAVQFADVPVMSAYLMLIAFFFVAINLMVDLLYLPGRSPAAHRPARRGGMSEAIRRPARSRARARQRLWGSFRRHRLARWLGGGHAGVDRAGAVLAPWIAPHQPL